MNVNAGRGATQLKTTRKKMISTEGVAQHAKCWRTACSVDFSVQEAGGCLLKAARRKILKPRGSVHWAHAGALRVNVIVVEAVFVVQEARACALKAAHRNAACVV